MYMEQYCGYSASKNIRPQEKREASERKRTILILIYSYLRESSLHESADTLLNEAQLPYDYEICDNVDLDIILQEYQSFYFLKFNKNPKMIKYLKENSQSVQKENKRKSNLTMRHSQNHGSQSSAVNRQSSIKSSGDASSTKNNANSNLSSTSATLMTNKINKDTSDFCFEVRNLSCPSKDLQQNSCDASSITDATSNTILHSKPLCDFTGYSCEWREMAELIMNDVVPNTLDTSWKNCIGLEKPIELLKEAIVYPLMHPGLYRGLVEPWRGILLYGPPGTGKTLLAKALACEAKSLIINVTSSSFVNKWRGESEKMLKVLFDVAKFYAPTTIFMDEVDALMSRHEDSQHDASRRFKSELLVHLDGIMTRNENVFILATTNKPWNLDSAVLRRFEKRILVNLPTKEARYDMFKYYFAKQQITFSEVQLQKMVSMTTNFSGSDIKLVCKEACMSKIREGLVQVANKEVKIDKLHIKKPCENDVICAMENSSPVTDAEHLKKYLEWKNKYGNN